MTSRSAQPSRAGTVPWPDDVAARYVAAGYWEGRPLGAHLLAAADARPDTVALVDGDLRLTYRELMERADGAALRLADLGLSTDDRIVVQLPNGWEFVVLVLACFRLGVMPVLALPAHRQHELTYLAQHAEARAIVVPDLIKGFDHQAMAHEIGAGVATVEHILVCGGHDGTVRPDSVDLTALLGPADDPVAARAALDANAPDSRSVAVFLLSGGTTGLPKLIARTHDDYAYNSKQTARICNFGPDTVYLAMLPLGHNFPLGSPGVLGALLTGGRVVIASSPVPEKAFPTIEAERVTITSAVTAIAQRWIDFRSTDRSHDISSLRVLQVGGSRLPDIVAEQITPALDCTLQQAYGMTEGLINYTRHDDPYEVICHTQGRPVCPDDEILIVDEHGEPVSPGEPGALLTRGPYTPRGYYRAEEYNSRAFVGDGWFRTGDVVRQRPDGNLVVEGRDKDLINRGGEKISAEEVEIFAYQLDNVVLAAAVAMPDAVFGEAICLYVVPHAGTTVHLRDVIAVMERAGVARFKLPERLVLADSLPTTAIGKVDKKALRADIEALLAEEQTDRAA